jgi:secreted Zn-dependent insulinase-like peptidase
MTRLPLPAALSLMMLVACPKTTTVPVAAKPAPAASVVKSPNDSRDYRTFVLDNGMRAVVIHDADTDMAAAALDVHIGQFADPLDRQGLSHFLEHMLFLGTEKYPEVGEYRKFITDHGGSSNAGTGAEHTTYHFSIEQGHLEPALDRFAQFFITPTLDPDLVDRERNAVHSEYSLKLKDEARRNREVMRATGNPDHPFAKFSVGNLDTLEDTEDNPLWDDLKAHYDATYSASRMAVGVVGQEDLDTLQQWVVDKFSAVPTDGVQKVPSTVPAFLPDQLGVRVNIVPLQEVRSLELQFPAPPTLEHFRTHPTDFITHLLGHEGEGSLFALLKSKGWIEGLQSGASGSEGHALMTVRLPLTEEGFQHIDEITGLIFQAIRLIGRDGIQERYHTESAAIAALNFRFADQMSPAGAARQARNLQSYPVDNLLNSWAVYDDFDANLVRDFLGHMRPDNMRMVVIAPGLETDKVEPLYQTSYSSTPLDAQKMAEWTLSVIDPALQLPGVNDFIATDVAIKTTSEATSPAKITDVAGLEVWHHQDVSFGVPEANVRVELFLPAPAQSVRSLVKNTLLTVLVDDSFEEFAYMPRLAGLYFDVGSSNRGIHLTVNGYNQKQPEIIAALTERLKGFQVDPERFEAERDQMARQWRNTRRARPMSQVSWAMSEALDPLDYSYLEGADLLDAVTLEEMQAWADSYLAQATARVLVHGNTNAAQAQQIGETIASTFVTDDQAARPNHEIRKIPAGIELVRDVEIDHDDSVFIAHYQGAETTLDEHARYMMLGQVLSTPFFNELRTKQQLGYSCHAYYSRMDRVPGLRFAIQSSSAGPVKLQQQTDAFVADFHAELIAMTDEDYGTIRDGLIAEIQKKELQLRRRYGRYTSELFLGFEGFDRRSQVVAALRSIDRQALVEFYAERLLADDASRFVGRSFGHAYGEAETHTPGCADTTCVTDKMTERFSRPL